MTVKELYNIFSERIPEHLREEWDNDGLMCSADTSAEVRRVLITLDVTEELVDYAIDKGVRLAFVQEGSAASESFIPPFDMTGVM